MARHDFKLIRHDGSTATVQQYVCMAAISPELHRQCADGRGFMLVIKGHHIPVDDEGFRACLLLESKLPPSVHYAYDAENIYIEVDPGAPFSVITTICFIWQVLRQPWERRILWDRAVQAWHAALERDAINARGDDSWLHALAWHCFTSHIPANTGHTFRTVPLWGGGQLPTVVANKVVNTQTYMAFGARYDGNNFAHFRSTGIFDGVSGRASRTIAAVRRALK